MIFLILGSIGISGHQSLHILRDITYALSPISLILIGYWIAEDKNNWHRILKLLTCFGIFFGIFHLVQFVINPLIIRENIDNIRKLINNPGGNIIILSLVFGIFQNKLKSGNLFPIIFPRFIALPLLSLSFFLSFSRTGYILFIILIIAISGVLSQIKLRNILLIGLFIIGIITIVITTPDDDTGTFRSKIAKSGREIIVSDYQNMVDIK